MVSWLVINIIFLFSRERYHNTCISLIFRYIAGVASLCIDPPDLESSRYHLDKAKELMETVLEHCRLSNEEFTMSSQYDLVKEHILILEDLERKINNGEHIASVDQREIFRKDRIASENACADTNMMVEEDEEWSSCGEEDTTIDEEI
jgi:hypothetical protein